METRLDRVRKIVCIILFPIIGALFIYGLAKDIYDGETWLKAKNDGSAVELQKVDLDMPKIILIPFPVVVKEEVEQPFHEMPLDLTQGEQDLLEQVAMAEAEGEGATGMALVMRVVLNRADLEGLPLDNIIYKPSQFATDHMGEKEPSEDCHKALAMVIDGWDESQGAIYFNKGEYPNYGEPLFQYGNHYFSK